ncbi:MAG: hypothetical protein EKK55_13515 [Rhodocyclaceae bacterium]|nr:MAG: hypothetical protein EKK55_13515 [Rhodocyclaceae bacterium]
MPPRDAPPDDAKPREITYEDIVEASKKNLAGVERLAAALGLGMPHMPREWSGYRRALVKRVARRLGAKRRDGRERWD